MYVELGIIIYIIGFIIAGAIGSKRINEDYSSNYDVGAGFLFIGMLWPLLFIIGGTWLGLCSFGWFLKKIL